MSGHIVKDEIKDVFSEFFRFHGVTDNSFDRIMAVSILRSVKKGVHVFFQDDPIRNLYFMYSGQIKIYKTDISGKEQILNFMTDGDVFPLESFYQEIGYPSSAQVTEDAILMVVPISKLQNILKENNPFFYNIYEHLGKKIIELQDTLDDQILYNAHKHKQIIKLLIRLGKRHGEIIQDEWIKLGIQLTNKELAEMIGVTRETVSRTLSKFARDGIVKKSFEGNLIFHPKALLRELD